MAQQIEIDSEHVPDINELLELYQDMLGQKMSMNINTFDKEFIMQWVPDLKIKSSKRTSTVGAGGGKFVETDKSPKASHPAQCISASDRVANCKPVTVVG